MIDKGVRNSFINKVEKLDLSRTPIDTVQVNIGKKCNQACLHCHVEAGPKRPENMTRETIDRLTNLIGKEDTVKLVDITGGAPELNPNFRAFVSNIRAMDKTVMDRCNLTVLFEKGQEDTAEFLAENKVQITASLPCYSKENVERQRGNGVFDQSIEALKILNKLGYGKPGSNLELNLVYNPGGPFLPPSQEKLQSDYKKILKETFDIDFNQLFTITNMPIKRFLHDLKRSNKLEEYMALLLDNFNPSAAEGIMCRNLVSIGWNGEIYDCDFNQMLEIPISNKQRNIWEISSLSELSEKPIAFDNHCFGCTAGSGSSCGGALT